MTDTIVVTTKSSWASKINWTQAVAFLAMLLTFFGIDLTPEMQATVLAAITAIQAVATIVIKTWFSPTVTTASAGMAGKL